MSFQHGLGLYLLQCSDDVERLRAVHRYRDIIAAWRTAAVVSVRPAKPVWVQVEQEIAQVCNAVRCAQENHVWLQGAYHLAYLERRKLICAAGICCKILCAGLLKYLVD